MIYGVMATFEENKVKISILTKENGKDVEYRITSNIACQRFKNEAAKIAEPATNEEVRSIATKQKSKIKANSLLGKEEKKKVLNGIDSEEWKKEVEKVIVKQKVQDKTREYADKKVAGYVKELMTALKKIAKDFSIPIN